MIDVQWDPARRLIRATMSGFLTLDEIVDFAAAEQAAAEAMGVGSGEFLLLVDSSGCVIQSQQTIAALQDFCAQCRLKARRIAVARMSSPTRGQTARILRSRADAAIFESRALAEAWLFSTAEPPAIWLPSLHR